MTARQKEIATLRHDVEMCKTLLAQEQANLEGALRDIENGERAVDSIAPAFYRASIAETRAWIDRDEARLSLLLEQEAGK